MALSLEDAIWAKMHEIVSRDSEKWKEDSSTSTCTSEPCGKKFTFRVRRHHCRICGDIFCKSCLTPVHVEADTELALTCGKCVKVLVERRKKEANAKILKRKKIKEALAARSSGDEQETKVQQAENVTSFQSLQQLKMRKAMSQKGCVEASKQQEEHKKKITVEVPEDWKSLYYRLDRVVDRTDVRWVQDDKVEVCGDCGITFDKVNRRHHCRACGNIYCDECSPFVGYTVDQAKEDSVRVCKKCAALILHKKAIAKQSEDKKARLVEQIAAEKRAEWQKNREQAENDKWTNKNDNWTDL